MCYKLFELMIKVKECMGILETLQAITKGWKGENPPLEIECYSLDVIQVVKGGKANLSRISLLQNPHNWAGSRPNPIQRNTGPSICGYLVDTITIFKGPTCT